VATLDNSSMTSSDLTYATACLVAALGFAALLLWLAFADRGDELRIHEHGFAYRHRGTVLECRWDEIANYQTRRGEIWAVMRRDGTWIHLSRYIPEVRSYVGPHLRVAQDLSPPRLRGRKITWTKPDPE
jgi:hypothetical protein